jgi:hypothetical protein
MGFTWKSELISGVKIYHDHTNITQITEIRTNYDSLGQKCFCDRVSYCDGDHGSHFTSHLGSDNAGHDQNAFSGYYGSENTALESGDYVTNNSGQLSSHDSSHKSGDKSGNYSAYYPGDDISHDGADKSSNRTPYNQYHNATVEVGHSYCMPHTGSIHSQPGCLSHHASDNNVFSPCPSDNSAYSPCPSDNSVFSPCPSDNSVFSPCPPVIMPCPSHYASHLGTNYSSNLGSNFSSNLGTNYSSNLGSNLGSDSPGCNPDTLPPCPPVIMP